MTTHDLVPHDGGMEPYEAPAVPALKAGPLDYPTVLALGKAFAASGLFPGVKDEGVAAIKILAGAEMGLEPVAAMNGIDIIAMPNRPPRMRPNADVQALLAARAGYTFTPLQHDETKCVLQWTHRGKTLGTSEFSIAQARNARLVRDGGAWQAWPMNMTLARAITQGIKLYCRHVLAGNIGGMAIVTSDELDDEYPDPRGDEIRALHATYREAFPLPPEQTKDEARDDRLDWSSAVLGRPVPSWNGPEAPETLTLADVRQLLDVATQAAQGHLSDRLRAVLGDDEIAGLNFLHRVLPDVAFETITDLDGKQRQVVHKALDALPQTDTQPALARELAAPALSADPSGTGAESTAPQSSAGVAGDTLPSSGSPGTPNPAPVEQSSAGTDSDEPGSVDPRSENPAEHPSEPAGDATAGYREVASAKPSGGTSAPRTKRPGKPNMDKARENLAEMRHQSATWNAPSNWLHTLLPADRNAALAAYGSPSSAHKRIQEIVSQEWPDLADIRTWADREWDPAHLTILMATIEAEKGSQI
jgi:hypothetical protein